MLAENLLSSTRERPGSTAVRLGATTCTYAELDRLTQLVSGFLNRQGVRVGVMLLYAGPDDVIFGGLPLFHVFGQTFLVGAVAVPRSWSAIATTSDRATDATVGHGAPIDSERLGTAPITRAAVRRSFKYGRTPLALVCDDREKMHQNGHGVVGPRLDRRRSTTNLLAARVARRRNVG
jgi:hypothetical protein